MANMSERARGANGNAENVIPLHEVDASVIDPTVTAEIISDDLITGIRSYAEMSTRHIKAALPTDGGLLGVDGLVARDAATHLTPDQQFAMAELNMLLAKHGKTPASSVEGIVQLREMLFATYRDNALVPKEVAIKLATLDRELLVLQSTRDEYVSKAEHEAKADTLGAEERIQAATQALENATAELQAARTRKVLITDAATTEVLEEVVGNKRRRGVANNDERVLDKVLDNDRLEKQIDAHKRSASIIWSKVVRPVIKPTIVVAVLATTLGVGFSYFVEMSGTVMYALLEPFNDIRHLIFDPVVGTIQKAISPPIP
jgi:hypothetical protein